MLNWAKGAKLVSERKEAATNRKIHGNVLVVEDEEVNRASLNNILSQDFNVTLAEDGQAALKLIQSRETTFHAVITDHRMPKMTGVELCRELYSQHHQATRMILTGYAELESLMSAVNDAGIFRYITKPVEPDFLLSLTHEAVAQNKAREENHRFVSVVKTLLENQSQLIKELEVAGRDVPVLSVPTELADLSDPRKIDMAVMFVDIRGFTKFSSMTPASEVMMVLQLLFKELHGIIYDCGGVVDKHLGDGLMAVFGLSGGGGTAAAARATQRIVETFPNIVGSMAREDVKALRLSVGTASGELLVGILGTDKRTELAIIGQPANLAARLQEFTKLALTLEAGKQYLGEFVSAMAVTTIDQCEKIEGFKAVDLPENLKVRDFKDITRVYVMSR
jgi:adenylate cyclase